MAKSVAITGGSECGKESGMTFTANQLAYHEALRQLWRAWHLKTYGTA